MGYPSDPSRTLVLAAAFIHCAFVVKNNCDPEILSYSVSSVLSPLCLSRDMYQFSKTIVALIQVLFLTASNASPNSFNGKGCETIP